MCSNVTVEMAATGEAVETLVETVLAGGLRSASHDQLAGLLGAARRLQAGLDYVVLAAVREADTRGSHVEDGALTIAAWTRMRTRMTPAERPPRSAPPGHWARVR